MPNQPAPQPRFTLWRSPHLWAVPLLLLLVVFQTLAAPDDVSPRHDETIAATSRALVAGSGYTGCLTQYFPLCQPGDPTAAREPLPVLLFAFQTAAGLRIDTMQIALNFVTGMLIYALAWRVFKDYRVGLAALLLWATYLPLLHTVNFYRAEPLQALLMVAFLLAFVYALETPRWWRFALLGIVLGATLLTRSVLLYGTVLILPGFYFAFGRRAWPALRRWLIVMLAAGLIVAPWAIRNALALGSPVTGTTLNGYNLLRHSFLIEGEDFLRYVSADEMQAHTQTLLAEQTSTDRMNEVEMNAFYTQAAVRAIMAHPLRYAALVAYRFTLAQWFDAGVADAYGYAGSPYQRYLIISNLILLPLAAWGALRLPRERWPLAWPLIGLFGFLSLIYPLVVTMFRYMVPAMPVVFMLAGYALFRRFPARSTRPILHGPALHLTRAAAIIAAAGLLLITAGVLPLAELKTESQRWVIPLEGPPAEAALRLTLPDGTQPCGVFDVGAHGERWVRMEDYPACSGTALTVRCLNGEAQWQADTVSDLVVSVELNTIRFVSAQHGTCGIFPTDTGAE